MSSDSADRDPHQGEPERENEGPRDPFGPGDPFDTGEVSGPDDSRTADGRRIHGGGGAQSRGADSGGGAHDPMEDMLASMLGPEMAAEALRMMKAQGLDPATMAGNAGMPTDPGQLSMLMGQVQRLFTTGGDGPVNWTLAEDLARQTAVREGDPAVSSAQASAVRDALRVADLWLDAATELPSTALNPQAWTRAEWVRHTIPTWHKLAEPVATSVTEAMVSAAAAQAEQLPPEMRQMLTSGAAAGMMRQMGGAVFGMQVGQAVGTMAAEAFGATDIGLPLTDGAGYALVPANVEAFAEGLDTPRAEVRQFLAVREAAHARLFTAVPWLRSHLMGAIEAYAREIRIDVSAIDEAMREVDPSDPERMADMLREKFSHGGMFGQEPTAAQTAALTRMETSLALVEGWVEEVTAQAVAPHLPNQVALREMLRRRRATGGPAEQTFAALVGLELRPKRVREAAQLWAALGRQRGTAERDALWQHPDLMPTPEELDNPQAFVSTREEGADAEMDVDAALEALLSGTLPPAREAQSPEADPTDDPGRDPGHEPGREPGHEGERPSDEGPENERPSDDGPPGGTTGR